jgi:hypothetical protein
MNGELIYPKSITIYGVFTGQMFLITSIIAFLYKKYYLALVAFILYLTTMKYWYEMKNDFFRYLDISISMFSILLISVYYAYFHFTTIYRNVWFIILLVCVLSYILNNFYYHNFNTFSYVEKKISVLFHLCFLHLLLPITFNYCFIMSF